MMDAKYEVGNILNILFILQLKQYQLKRELRDFDGPRNFTLIKQLYAEIIRLGARALTKISQLMIDEKCLNRPFVFK